MLATASADTSVKIWDLNNFECVCTFNQNSYVYTVSFHPQGEILASGNHSGEINIYNIKEKKIVKSFKIKEESARNLQFSHNGKFLASSNYGNLI